jgi:hypothetical protein
MNDDHLTYKGGMSDDHLTYKGGRNDDYLIETCYVIQCHVM